MCYHKLTRNAGLVRRECFNKVTENDWVEISQNIELFPNVRFIFFLLKSVFFSSQESRHLYPCRMPFEYSVTLFFGPTKTSTRRFPTG